MLRKVLIVLLVVVIIGLVVYGTYSLFHVDTCNAKIVGFGWQRVISIQEYKVVSESGWSYPPNDAYNVNYERKFHHFNPIYGVVSSGDTTIVTVVAQIPVYDNYYTYNVNRWRHSRNVTTSGDDRNPYWGEYSLQSEGQQILGAERVSGSSEKYTVYFQTIIEDQSAKNFSIVVNQADWVEYSTDSIYKLKINSFGSIINDPLREEK